MPGDLGDLDAGTALDDTTADVPSRHHPPDASLPPADAKPSDAMPSDDGGGGGGGLVGVVSCYTEGFPSTTCSLPTHCDGPEDCASGSHCCAHANVDPDYGLTGYTLACQATACGTAPINQELCHPTATSASGTCPSGKTCVTALGNDNDLPRTLSICK
jgi:hypothetical protein